MPAADSLKMKETQYLNFWGQQLGDQLPDFIQAAIGERGWDPKEFEASGMSKEQLEALRQLVRGQADLPTDAGTPWQVSAEKWLGTAAQTPFAEARAARDAEAAQARERGTINDQIQRFIDSMTGPMAPNDPVRLSLVQAGQDAAQGAMGRAGVGGRSGLGATSAASLAQQNILPYEQQRKAWAAQGLGLLNNRDLSLGDLALRKQAMDNSIAESKWAAQQNAQQGIGSAIGAGLMAIPGVALSGYTGGASLGLIPAGASLGGGVASIAGGGSGPSYSSTTSTRRGANPYTGY